MCWNCVIFTREVRWEEKIQFKFIVEEFFAVGKFLQENWIELVKTRNFYYRDELICTKNIKFLPR